VLSIPTSLKSGEWALLPDLTTNIRNAPTMPLTTLQKRWLRALLDDPRMRLFAPLAEGLEVIIPFRNLMNEFYECVK